MLFKNDYSTGSIIQVTEQKKSLKYSLASRDSIPNYPQKTIWLAIKKLEQNTNEPLYPCRCNTGAKALI